MAEPPTPRPAAVDASSRRVDMTASVILVARDRRRDLERALASVADQRLEEGTFEVLVVDDGSSDGTWEMLATREAGPGAPPRTVLRHPRSRGPGLARNAAARRARGAVLVFLDSDCRAQPGWLAALLAPLRRPDIGAVGGAEVLDPAAPFWDRVFHLVLTSALTTGGLRGRPGVRVGRYRPRSYSMAVRREVFERCGGFAGLRHGEDLDLSVRIARLGFRLAYASDSRVHHRRRPDLASFLHQAFAMGRARATLLRRDRRHLEPACLVPALLWLGAVGLGLAALASRSARVAAVPVLLVALVYLGAVGLLAAVRLRALRALPLAPLAFAGFLASYGAGFFLGLVSPFREEV
ncbi:MAG: glycosyltransferase family 2 protein [Planctomycetota bacterium]